MDSGVDAWDETALTGVEGAGSASSSRGRFWCTGTTGVGSSMVVDVVVCSIGRAEKSNCRVQSKIGTIGRCGVWNA